MLVTTRHPGDRILIATICLASLLFLSSLAAAAQPYTSLQPIELGTIIGEDVALGPDKAVYIADSVNDRILIFDENDQLNGILSVQGPKSVAVGPGGRIYVGSAKGSVTIFDAAGVKKGMLGEGKGEFKLPRNITISPYNGDVYVVDQLAHSIKVYSADGLFSYEIDDSPNLPQDAVIANGLLYVVDQPLSMDDHGGSIRQGEVQIFDLSGNYLGDMGAMAAQDYTLSRPKAITSDGSGNLLVSDHLQGSIFVLNPEGQLLYTIKDQGCSPFSPSSLAIDSTGILAVTTTFCKSVRFFLTNPVL